MDAGPQGEASNGTALHLNGHDGEAAEQGGPPLSSITTRQLLTGLQAIQSRRAALYGRLSDGFRSLLATKQEAPFRKLLVELTDAFSACSREVIAIETGLKVGGRSDLAASLRRVQEAERDKLRYTLTWQALKQAATALAEAPTDDDTIGDTAYANGHAQSRGEHSHYHAAAAATSTHATTEGGNGVPSPATAATATATAEPESATGAASAEGAVDPAVLLLLQHQSRSQQDHANHGVGDDGGGCGCGAAPPAPTEQELSAAMGEALQLLDKAIVSVNDVLDELRYEVDDE